MTQPDIYCRTMIDVLSPDLKQRVQSHFTMQQFVAAGTTREDRFAGQGVIPLHEMARHTVFQATEARGSYNHHPNIVQWKGAYWVAWDNGMINEEWPGQRTLIARSEDGMRWSEPTLVADGDVRAGMLRNVGGLYARGDTLYAFIQEMWDLVHATEAVMSAHENKKVSYRNDLWGTTDGTNWTLRKAGYIDARWMCENPRLTREGCLMGPISDRDNSPGVVLWPSDNPEETPFIVHHPWHANKTDYYVGHDEGRFMYGEASWYTDDADRIWMFWRDESYPTYLGVTLSEDGGRNWTEVMRSNFPDCGSRIAAGRLADGRFFLVGNSTRVIQNRNFFSISLSQDGAKFNTMRQLVREPTRQRFAGHLKAHGHQYPSCLVDGDRLLIAHSVNKEDIAVGIVDTLALR